MKKNEMFKHIVAIRTEKNNSVIGGTGFFVKTEDDKMFLVTATHVARDTTINTDIWVRNLATGLPFAFKINQLNKMVIWLYHPIADIAVLEVEPNKRLDLSLYVLPISFFEKSFTSIPERESIVTMYGMPDVYASRRPSGLRKTNPHYNSLAHRTTWLRSDFIICFTDLVL